jgi:biofilm PGA synthesis N-glycosyltransferase PgaC
MMAGVRYAVVSPARDEIDYIGRLAESLLTQTLPFETWVVVDDGSTDGTQEMIRDLAQQDRRVRLIVRSERPRRTSSGDIESANIALASLGDLARFDYVAKLDTDLAFDPDYFERLFAEFERDPSLGIAGGHCYNPTKNGLVLDKVPDSHVRGATKTYRRECLQDVWPLVEIAGWDTVDECRAQMAGWRTRSFTDPGVIHLKPATGGTSSRLRGKFGLGRISHHLGYRPDFLLARAAKHLAKPPYVIGGFAMGWGYLSAALLRKDVFEDADVRAYLRSQQAHRLRAALLGHGARKGRAT